jgi:hypothetical protein
VKIGAMTVMHYLRVEINFYPTFRISWPIWAKFGSDYLNTMPLSKWGSRENRYSKSQNLIKAVNIIMFVFSMFIARLG